MERKGLVRGKIIQEYFSEITKIANEIELKIRDIIAGESKPEPISKNNGASEDVVDE